MLILRKIICASVLHSIRIGDHNGIQNYLEKGHWRALAHSGVNHPNRDSNELLAQQ